jgi:sirohydrochlorin ferrochelatase
MQKKTIFLYVFHGSKKSSANLAAKDFVERLSSVTGEIAAIAYLQFCEPSFKKVLEELCAAGNPKIHVKPMFILPGSHLENDIPEIISTIQKSFKSTEILFDGALIQNEDFVEFCIKNLEK